MQKPVYFYCIAPRAKHVELVGDFNEWTAGTNLMDRQPDGSWRTQVALHHGHHHYQFLVDGEPTLDPNAQGIARNVRNERVSMMAVS